MSGRCWAFSLVLHTWTQTLVRHLHLHALVAGGALAADGGWVSGKAGFLFPTKTLSSVFRGKFMAGIIAAHACGQLQPDALQLAKMTAKQIKQANQVWRTMLAQLRKHYTHRIAISNERLTSLHDGTVTFAVRNNEPSGPRSGWCRLILLAAPAARQGISMSRLRLRQIAATQPKPVHTKPGRRHEKTSWLHQETLVIHMALGWARGKLGLMPGWAANSPQATC